MSTNTPKLDLRLASAVARAIVRMWPAETREWGQAFAAELPAVEMNGGTLSWLIGGVMVMLREWWKHAWRSLGRPIGSRGEEPGGTFTRRYSRLAQTPLWVMLLLVASSAAILLHPEMRQAFHKIHGAYTHSDLEPERWASTQALREISKSNRDPQLLALLSLLSDNGEERLRLSDEVIRKDASLTWLDYEQSLLPRNDLSRREYLSKEKIERLKKWDPENAVPHLLAAEMIAKPMRTEAFDALMRGKGSSPWENNLATNSEWTTEMHAAFTAPKFDSYTSQVVELVRNVSARFAMRDPEVAVYVLVNKRLPQIDLDKVYAGTQMGRAAAFAILGKTREAATAYSEILQFSQRVSMDGNSPLEQYFAEQIGELAGNQLAPLYDSMGRADEASLVRFQVVKWSAERDPRILRYMPVHYRQSDWNTVAWSGMIMSWAGLCLLVVFPVAVIGVFLVCRRKNIPLEKRGAADYWASICADFAPWLLFASSALLYLTYHPYAKLCAGFLKGGISSPGIETFLRASMVPNITPDYMDFLYDPYSQWIGITAVLCVILVFFFWRMILRTKHAA